MRVLVINSGSSSLKLSIVGSDEELLFDRATGPLQPGRAREGLEEALAGAPDADVVGHRVVHGGPTMERAVLVGGSFESSLAALEDLAPLHNPKSVEAIRVMQELRPRMRQVACFDTAFHGTMPPEAYSYALPAEWRDGFGLRRYGFHGLSHAWASSRAAEILQRPLEQLRVVSAHLGAGASAAAVAFGRSVDTTMGFTPLEGLVMATRPGNVDPGVLLWVMRHRGAGVDELEDVLENRSGLLGLSESSGDLRHVIEAADGGDAKAALAYAVYVHRLRGALSSMAAAMEGVDAIVFTGGAGEGSPRLRHDVCEGLSFLGVAIDAAANLDFSPRSDSVVSLPRSSVATLVVHAREDLQIAREVRALLDTPR